MLKNININIDGLTKEISKDVVNSLESILKEFSFLDFRRFNDIKITPTLEKDVDSLINSNKKLFQNNYNKNENTYAVILTIPKENDFELVLVLKSDFIKNIVQNHDNQEYKDTFHIIHHELAHIHDNNKKIDIFKELMLYSSYKGIDSITYSIAQTCWSEYIANYLSSSSAQDTQYPLMMAKSFAKKIKETKQNIKTELLAYKINKDRDDLLLSSIEQVESLLKSASYLIGYLHGLNLTLAELDERIDYLVDVSYFKDIWQVMHHEFISILNVYPDAIINLSIYKNLTLYIETFYKQMGIEFYLNDKKELRINII
jgi:hypothetical protein